MRQESVYKKLVVMQFTHVNIEVMSLHIINVIINLQLR